MGSLWLWLRASKLRMMLFIIGAILAFIVAVIFAFVTIGGSLIFTFYIVGKIKEIGNKPIIYMEKPEPDVWYERYHNISGGSRADIIHFYPGQESKKKELWTSERGLGGTDTPWLSGRLYKPGPRGPPVADPIWDYLDTNLSYYMRNSGKATAVGGAPDSKAPEKFQYNHILISGHGIIGLLANSFHKPVMSFTSDDTGAGKTEFAPLVWFDPFSRSVSMPNFRATENEIFAKYPNIPYTILKVNMHGNFPKIEYSENGMKSGEGVHIFTYYYLAFVSSISKYMAYGCRIPADVHFDYFNDNIRKIYRDERLEEKKGIEYGGDGPSVPIFYLNYKGREDIGFFNCGRGTEEAAALIKSFFIRSPF